MGAHGGEWGAVVNEEQGQPRPLATAVESLGGQTPAAGKSVSEEGKESPRGQPSACERAVAVVGGARREVSASVPVHAPP